MCPLVEKFFSPEPMGTPAPATPVGVDRVKAFVTFLAGHPTLRRSLVNATFSSRRQAAAYVVATAGQLGYNFTVGDYKALVKAVMQERHPHLAEKARLLDSLGAPRVSYLAVPYRG